ncbi:GSCOCG00002704001-RA-CDS, partial [Cotesia congregata]
LSLGGDLIVLASALSDASYESPTRYSFSSTSGSTEDNGLPKYQYGWCLQLSGFALILAEIAALLTVSGYMARFPTVEEMVCIPFKRILRKYKRSTRMRIYKKCVSFEISYQRIFLIIDKKKISKIISVSFSLIQRYMSKHVTYADNTKSECLLDAPLGFNRYNSMAGQTVPITLKHQNSPTVSAIQAQAMYQNFGTIHSGILRVSEPGTSSSSNSSQRSMTLQNPKRKSQIAQNTFSTLECEKRKPRAAGIAGKMNFYTGSTV